MRNNIQLPAKRVIEGEVVKDIGDLTFTVKLDFSPKDLQDFIQAMVKAKQSIAESQRKGIVRPVIHGDNLDNCIDGECSQ